MWKLLIGAALGYVAGRASRDASSLRPTVKAALKTGVRAFEKGTEAMAHLRESFDDIAAEVRADLESQAAAEREKAREEEHEEVVPRRAANRRSPKRKPQQEEVEQHAPARHR